MKKYYSTLSKEEKAKIKEIYQKEYKNSEVQVRLVRLLIYAGIGYITSTVIYLDAFLNNNEKTWSIVIATILLIASTMFLIGNILVKRNVLNKIALKRKK